MRIFEITDKNKVVISISGININFETEYQFLINLLLVLIKLKTPARNQKALRNIEDFKNRIHHFRQSKLLDRLDPDIIELDSKLREMEYTIDTLLTQLIL